MALLSRKKRTTEEAEPLDHQLDRVRRPTTVGGLLREAREARGLDVERVGATLRIRPAYLQAIEEDRYDRLPGAAYALGFVRAYAEFVGLDGADVARRYKQEATGLEARPDLSFPVALPERSRPGGAIFLVALILAACGYGLWYYVSTGERSRPERVAAVPAQLLPPPAPPAVEPPKEPAASEAATPAPEPAPDAPAESATASNAGEPTPAATSPAATSPAATSPAQATPSQPQAAPAVAASPTASAPAETAAAVPAVPAVPEPPAAAPAEGPKVYGLANTQSRIQIKATADSWIEVKENDQSIWRRILKPGEVYRVPDRPGLTMVTGNAGALEISVDGKPVPPVGPAGKRRTVSLDPERLMASATRAAAGGRPEQGAHLE